MNVLEPWFERWLVYDTYACRKGRGQLAVVSRAQVFARRHEWFLKCDVRKFFDSIPHAGLERMIERKIKDRRVAAWLLRIVGTYETSQGRGLPIGNLTSQHLANLYLDGLDRFVAREKGACGAGGYVRYMDDVVASGDKRVLRGGSWNNNARNCRSANRNNNDPGNRNNNNGFRPCSSAAPQDATDSENPANRAVPAAVPSGARLARRAAGEPQTPPRHR